MKPEIKINNDILLWAIERSGLSVDEVSKKIPPFISWLEGKKSPTFKQLQIFAQKVYLPFGYLFLEKPPEEKLPIPFFRTNRANKEKIPINVFDAILIVQQRQEWLSNYLKENDYDRINFVGKFRNKRFQIDEVVADIRNTLNIKESWAKELSTWEEAINYLTDKIEEAGIIINSSGIVGNNTRRKIKVDDCRGFVLIDEYAPFLFVNSADSKSAQIFTLAHELAHIWLGESAGFDFRHLLPADNPTEILCDKIAAEFLVPQKELTEILTDVLDIENIARRFKVSQIVIARRLLDLGKITRNEFFEFYDEYISRDIQKKGEKEGGGDFYKTQRKRLSTRFLSYVNQAVLTNKLLLREAYQLTGLKGDTYNKFMKEHLY
ncbi:ImmA/IrrE family metallo-endopeptidase [Ignavibacterium sp.]|uniref:ImmA/IrrE family metallo-endopeptidase n=1 Tax=Ignavibacterium sp. TaxID=2651167 RepID=UPI002205825F|nr:ImmA/IrrE family metallo-endopeptidase [Ignavibacterium sp.]BDQ02285.1 MAG: DNA-binding protein [Ignavibacterium sp.]